MLINGKRSIKIDKSAAHSSRSTPQAYIYFYYFCLYKYFFCVVLYLYFIFTLQFSSPLFMPLNVFVTVFGCPVLCLIQKALQAETLSVTSMQMDRDK